MRRILTLMALVVMCVQTTEGARNKSARKGREELSRHLEKVVGTATPKGWKFRFVKPLDEPDVCDFESFYRIDKGVVWFWGDDRVTPGRHSPKTQRWGSLFAVFLFLENELGVRWLWPGEAGISYKQVKELSLPIGKKERYCPPLEMSTLVNAWWAARKFRKKEGKAPVGLRDMTEGIVETNIAERTRFLLCHRLEDRLFIPVKTGDAFLEWRERFGKEHPEYLNWSDRFRNRGYTDESHPRFTKLCVSNEAVIDQIIEDWCEAGTNMYLNVKENDGTHWCECSFCRALDCPCPGEKDLEHLTDRYLNFLNRVCRKAVAIRKNVKVLSRIYSNYRCPPRRERLEYPDNVLIDYVPSMYDDLSADLRKWKSCGLKAFILRPNFHCYRGMVPRGLERVIFNCFQDCRQNGMLGVYYDAVLGRLPMRLETYVTVRMMSDPTVPFERLCDEYYAAFGAAEPEVRRYFDMVRTNGERARLECMQRKTTPDGAFDDSLVFSALQISGRTEEELEEECRELKAAYALHEAELSTDECRRLKELVVGAEHAVMTYRFVDAQRISTEALETCALELIEFRRKNSSWLQENWGDIFGAWSGESRIWAKTKVWQKER